VNPVELPPNQLHHFYRGGEAIASFRGIRSTDDHAPEDWVGSTATMFGADGAGLSALPDGRLLRDAIAADPVAYLGPAHTAQHGTDCALLVKLLDAGERLPVHFHPDQAFARSHLGLAHGKTEAWLIVETRGERPTAWLGFREDVDLDVLAGWVDRQDRATLLDALNELTVGPGDCFFVPAFSFLVVVDGDGRLDTEGGTETLSRGESLLVPHAAGPGELTGSVDVIRCLPPAPNGDPTP